MDAEDGTIPPNPDHPDIHFMDPRPVYEDPLFGIRRSILLFGLCLVLVAIAAGVIYFTRKWFYDPNHVAFAQSVSGIVLGLPTLIFVVAAVAVANRASERRRHRPERHTRKWK